jgi:hypothetical protein
MFAEKVATLETAGAQVVRLAKSGERGAGQYDLTPADCQLILDECDFKLPVADPTDQQTNRAVNDQRTHKYVESMTNEGVIDTGDTLKFDTNGNLFDGKHRLTAAIQAGVMFDTLIAFGRSTKAFAVVDSAIGGRNKKELFRMAKIRRAPLMSSVTEVLTHWRGGSFAYVANHHTGEELINFYLRTIDDDLIQDCAAHCERAYTRVRYPTTPLCAMLYLLRVHGDEEKALAFVDAIARGDWDGKNAALGCLFAHWNTLRATPGMMIRPAFKLAMLILTWNNFLKGHKGSPQKLSVVPNDIPLNLTKS